MESLLFCSTHREVLGVVRLTGYPLPWFATSSPGKKRVFSLYYKILFVLNLYMLACVIVSMCTVQSIAEFATLMATSLSFTAVLSNYYFSASEEDFRAYIWSVDSMRVALERSSIAASERLKLKLEHHSRFTSLLAQISVFGIGLAAVFFIVPLPGLTSESPAFPLLDGFHRKESRAPLATAFRAFTLSMIASKKTALDCFFISLFRLQVIYSRHLNYILRQLSEDWRHRSDDELYPKIREWIILHQMLDRNNRALISLYAPIIVMYYFNLLTIFASSIYILLSNEGTTGVQATMDLLWLLSLLCLLYLQSTAADDLAVVSEKMALGAFSLPFYQLRKRSGEAIRLVILYTNRPIQVTARRAQVFIMNRESFRSFISSVVSCYITFKRLDSTLRNGEN